MMLATAVESRKSLEAANMFVRAGIRFIPVPVIDDADHARLFEDVEKRLSLIEQFCEEKGGA